MVYNVPSLKVLPSQNPKTDSGFEEQKGMTLAGKGTYPFIDLKNPGNNDLRLVELQLLACMGVHVKVH